MVRRLFSILSIFVALFIAVGIIVVYVTFPIWLFIWLGTGKWIYPPANALAQNLMNWVRVRSTDKSFVTGEYYTKEDYHTTFKRSLRTQSFDD